MSKHNNTRASDKPRRKVKQQRGSQDPPQIKTNIVLKHRYRFRTTAAFSGGISPAKIFGSLGTIGTVANTTVSILFKSFRLRKLEIWSPPPSQGATVTNSVEWLGTANSPSIEVSDTSVSVSRPAHIMTMPPRSSLAGFWQLNTGSTLFNLNAPIGSIIDLSCDMIVDDSGAAVDTIAAATVVLGKIYYLALDHGTSDLIVPVSLTTTV